MESLLIKSFSEQANEEEERVIREWKAESESNRREFEAFKKLWDDSKKLMVSNAIDVEAALQKTKKQIPQFGKKYRLIFYWRQAAAILVLSVLLSSLYNYFGRSGFSHDGKIVYQEVRAAYGTQTQLELADGTQVWLNAGSKLNFPISFNQQEERKVTLEGEGFFKVTKDAKHPFIVHTTPMDIKVLGTSFNVNAYKGQNVTVALEEGRVSLLKQSGGMTKEVLSLKPLEVANYDVANNKIFRTKENNLERYIAWKEGLIIFSEDPLSKVISRLDNWYNVDIKVSDKKLLSYHITGTFDDNSLDQVLYFLSLTTPINYKILPNNHNQRGTKQTIVLSPKMN